MSDQNSVGVPVSRWRTSFEVVSTFVMIVLAAALVWQGRSRFLASTAANSPAASAPIPKVPIQIDGSMTLGTASARAVVIEYADFECSACRQFAKDIEPALIRDYVDRGRAKFVFKNFPLVMHVHGSVAAAAASCAARQGRFWQMHDWLFAAPPHLDDDNLQNPAGELGLDVSKYNSCRTAPEGTNSIQTARSEGEALKVTATPTFFFGTMLPDGKHVHVTETMTGYRSVQSFKDILDRLPG